MKQLLRIFICVVVAFTSMSTYAQKNKGPEFEISQDSSVCDTIWIMADKPVEFPGGTDAMYTFLFDKMKNGGDLHAVNTQKMMVKMLVSSDGSVLEKKVLRSLDPETTQDVLQAMDQFPKLIPAQKNGKDVCSYFLVLVNLLR